MFFDDATKRKPAGKVQLRLAADNGAPDNQHFESRESDAARRHRAARTRREPAGPSLLDQINAISERQAMAEREAVAELEAQMAELAAVEAAVEKQRQSQSAARRSNPPAFRHSEPTEHPLPGEAEEFPDHIPQSQYRPQTTDNQDGAPLIDPRFVFRSVRSLRYLIAATTVLGGLAGVYVAMNTPKLYFSSATIVVDPRNYKVIENDLNPDVFLSEAALAIVDSQVSLMRSPRVLEQVAANLKLANDPEFNGSAKRGLSSFLGLLTGGKVEDYQGGALKYLAEHMSAERSPKTFVVNVGAYSESPEKAALIANAIVDVYLEEQASTRSDLAKRTSGELGSRLENLKSDVEKAENKVEAFKSENNLVGAQGRLIEDEEILRVNDQLTAARSTTITLNSRAQSAKSATVEAVASGGLPEEVASAGLTALRSQYVAAKQRRDGLSAKLGPMHPDLLQANNELASLTGAINAEINRIRLSIQTDLKRAVETEQQLAARLAQVKARQGNTGEAQVQLRELEREAASARTVYEQYLLRARETGEQGNINANNVQKISEARPSDTPEGASRKFIVLGGAIAGFVIGLGLAIAKGMFDALRVRFRSGNGESAPAAPSMPSGGPSGGARRRLGKMLADTSGKLPAWAGAQNAPSSPQPVMQQPTPPYQTAQQPMFQPLAHTHVQPQAAPVFAPQTAMQAQQYFSPAPIQQPVTQTYVQPLPVAPIPVQHYAPPATVQQPVMQTYAQPLSPVQYHVQPQPAPAFMLQPQVQAYPQMSQPVYMPQQMQPPMQPVYPQWQQEPAMSTHSYAQQQAPSQPINQQQPLVHTQQQAPGYQRPEPVLPPVRHAPQPQPQPQFGDIQGSLNELRAELLDIARRRRSA